MTREEKLKLLFELDSWEIKSGFGAYTLTNDKMFRTFHIKFIFALEALLTYILMYKVVNIKINPTHNLSKYVNAKEMIMDLVANVNNNKWFLVEMQNKYSKSFINRYVSYARRFTSNLIKTGNNYSQIPQTISIALLNNYPKIKSDRYKYIFKTTETKSHTPLTNDLTHIIIDIENAKKAYKLDKTNPLLQNIIFLDNHRSKEAHEIMLENDVIFKERLLLKELFEDPVAMFIIQKQIDRITDAEKVGEERGKIEGIKEGKIEGKKVGIKEGKAVGEKYEKVRVAKELLKNGSNIELIIKVTGLSKEQIENLKKEIQL